MGQAPSVLVDERGDSSGQPGQVIVSRTPWQLFWGRFVRDRAAIAGAILIVELIILALIAPLVSKWIGHGPNDIYNHMTNEIGLPKGPNSQFWFGADVVGRDLFVRVIYAIRTSLTVALLATGFSVVIGVLLGTIAGFFGRGIDTVISRLVDIVMSLPLLLFAIGIAAACSITSAGCLGGLIQPGLMLPVFIIALFNWTYIARIVRGQTLSIREREFIQASESLGATNWRIMFREILPNLVAPIIVYSTLIIPSNILFEAALSFLGVGIPQTTPSLGRMLADASSGQLFIAAPWMMLYPGVILVLMTLAFNLLGDGLRDALDPRGGGRR
jgi:peptide/nickel transport system permease protein